MQQGLKNYTYFPLVFEKKDRPFSSAELITLLSKSSWFIYGICKEHNYSFEWLDLEK